MKKLTKDEKIASVLLILALVVGLVYVYIYIIFNCSRYDLVALFEVISFHWGAVWCLLMVIACRKLRLFEDVKDGVNE